ncbi:MAG: STAS domain-containing protein [Chloroflexi bacterium]|nr:STAS domain-containing protein [Chloroflexota bacterium]
MDLAIAPHAPGVAVVHPHGRLDLLAAQDVKTRLTETVAAGHQRLVVDLTDVPFIDSSGLGALIGGLKAARQAGGDLRIARPGEQPRTVLQLTTLDRVLRPYATVEEALAGL